MIKYEYIINGEERRKLNERIKQLKNFLLKSEMFISDEKERFDAEQKAMDDITKIKSVLSKKVKKHE